MCLIFFDQIKHTLGMHDFIILKEELELIKSTLTSGHKTNL